MVNNRSSVSFTEKQEPERKWPPLDVPKFMIAASAVKWWLKLFSQALYIPLLRLCFFIFLKSIFLPLFNCGSPGFSRSDFVGFEMDTCDSDAGVGVEWVFFRDLGLLAGRDTVTCFIYRQNTKTTKWCSCKLFIQPTEHTTAKKTSVKIEICWFV